MSCEEYNNRTKCSDFNIFVPALFFFFHGTELLIKGLLTYKNINFEKKHYIDELINQLSSATEIDLELISTLNKYFRKKPKSKIISSFIKNKEKSFLRNLHVSIRYPEEKNGMSVNFDNLRYQEKELICEIKNLIKVIKT